ncbi:MAG: NAD(P)-dependent oxidoreductase, partial [Elainellaceae cyanobacterium]
MTTVACLGAGAMGSRIAQNLLNAGYPVLVYNRTRETVNPLLDCGAQYVSTPRDAAEQADIIISMVTDDAASRAVWLTPETGAIAGFTNRSTAPIAIESSTLTVDWVVELAGHLEGRARFLDAPVVGSRPQAEAAKLTYLVGGDAETLAEVTPLLQVSGAVRQVGPIGQGMALKLAVNALFGIQVAALGELLGALTHQGLSQAQAMDCLSGLPVLSPAANVAGGLMVSDRHAPLFPIHLVEKDFRYALGLAGAEKTPLSAAAHGMYQDAIAQG